MAKIKLNLKIVREHSMTYINRAPEQLLQTKFKKSKSVAVIGARQVDKTIFEIFKYLNAEKIGYNQPSSLPYPTENPFEKN